MISFQSLKNWISLNEGGAAIPSSRPITWEEAQLTYNWVLNNIIPKLGITHNDVEIIGSYGKKIEGETHGDLDLAISAEALKEKNNLSDSDLLNFISDTLLNLGFETKPMSGFRQVSAGINIPGTKDIAQVDFMISPGLDWSKFVYHSPNFRKSESKYKGVYRNALLMAIITETSKNIIKKTDTGDIEEIESNVIRFPEGIWKARKSFMGKKGLVKTGQLLRNFDEFVTTNPQEVVNISVGPEYTPDDINTFEKLWSIVTNDNYMHLDKINDIMKKFDGNLKSMGIDYPIEAINKFTEIFN